LPWRLSHVREALTTVTEARAPDIPPLSAEVRNGSIFPVHIRRGWVDSGSPTAEAEWA